MGLTVFLVIGFLVTLGFMTFINSRKASKEIKNWINKTNSWIEVLTLATE